MIKSKILDENLEYKNFIEKLKNNIITCGTGVGKYNLVYDWRPTTESDGKVVNDIIGEGFYEVFIIDKDGIEGSIRTDMFKNRIMEKTLILKCYLETDNQLNPEKVLEELYLNDDVPCKAITQLCLINLNISKSTMNQIKRNFPNLSSIYIYNSFISADAFFNYFDGIRIRVENSIIENMRVFSGAKRGSLYIEKSKVLKPTREHLTFNFYDIEIFKTTLNMPTFLINTDMPNVKKLKISKKRWMNNLDATFLTAPNLEELSLKAELSNVEIIRRNGSLERVTDLVLNVAKDPEFLKLFKKNLIARINYLSGLVGFDKYGADSMAKYFEENCSHVGEEGYSSLVSAPNLQFLYLVPNRRSKRFYNEIKLIYDPLDINNWVNKSRNQNAEDIVKELLIVDRMPYQLRKEIGRKANTIIEVPKQGDFIDIFEKVKDNNRRFDENVNCINVSASDSKIQDVLGNLYGLREKFIYSSTHGVLTSFTQEYKFVEEEYLSQVIKKFAPDKNHILSYQFKTFYQELKREARRIEARQDNKIKRELEKQLKTPVNENCPECGEPLIYKKGKYGIFISCSNYPKCKYIKDKLVERDCPECGKPLTVRVSRFGPFISCQDFPNCKHKEKLSEEFKEKSNSRNEYEIYDELFYKYVNNALKELFAHQDIINSFTTSDYKNIKDMLPKIYNDFSFSDYEKFMFICMAYKYITGNFPSMLEKAFSNIIIPDEIRALDEDDILEIVQKQETRVHYRDEKTFTYKKAKSYWKKSNSEEENEELDYDPEDLPF